MDQQSPLSAQEIELRRAELDTMYRLGYTGLWGTLIAVLAGMVMIVVLAWMSPQWMSGWQLVFIFATVAVTVAVFGSFIYGKSLTISARRSVSGEVAANVGTGNSSSQTAK